MEYIKEAEDFLKLRSKQKDNLVITRKEAIYYLSEFAKYINKEKIYCPKCDNPYPNISKEGTLSCGRCGYINETYKLF